MRPHCQTLPGHRWAAPVVQRATHHHPARPASCRWPRFHPAGQTPQPTARAPAVKCLPCRPVWAAARRADWGMRPKAAERWGRPPKAERALRQAGVYPAPTKQTAAATPLLPGTGLRAAVRCGTGRWGWPCGILKRIHSSEQPAQGNAEKVARAPRIAALCGLRRLIQHRLRPASQPQSFLLRAATPPPAPAGPRCSAQAAQSTHARGCPGPRSPAGLPHCASPASAP